MQNLTKIRIPKKYHSAIDKIYKDIEGYFVELKEGYIFESSECGIEVCDTQKEVLERLYFITKEDVIDTDSVGSVESEVNEETAEIDSEEDSSVMNTKSLEEDLKQLEEDSNESEVSELDSYIQNNINENVRVLHRKHIIENNFEYRLRGIINNNRCNFIYNYRSYSIKEIRDILKKENKVLIDVIGRTELIDNIGLEKLVYKIAKSKIPLEECILCRWNEGFKGYI